MLIGLISILSVLPVIVAAQEKKKSGFQEVYTGTIVSMNGGLASSTFSLNIKDYTSDADAQRYLALLAEGDQTNLLDAIRNLKMGKLTPERHVGRDLLVARKTQLPDNRMRIVVAFERWQRFVEIRNGYRTLDYPFGIMEIVVDSKGKGGGTFIAACKIDLKRDKKTGKYQLELENFGSFPHKVMGVMLRK
jgi:hypothetical protein